MIVPLFVGSGKRFVAVLTPKEELAIYDQLNDTYKKRVDFLRETYVRISEAYFLTTHPECYRKDNGHIFLPNVAGLGKDQCTIKNRAVLLSERGRSAVESFYANKITFPRYQSMEEALKRAARDADIDPLYITTKMYRKTTISWLMACFPELGSKIQYASGHNYNTMQGSYVTYGFKKNDISDMRARLLGWGEGL